MTRITIVSDAWLPQINGAVTTLLNTVCGLEQLGYRVTVIEPRQFPLWPCPTYPEISLARTSAREMGIRLEAASPDYVLIATEGPLGFAARRALMRSGSQFNTALFTRFHDYLWMRFRLPKSMTLRGLTWFHRPASTVLTPTRAMQKLLQKQGLVQAQVWTPGVDSTLFAHLPGVASRLVDALPRPILLYVGRIAVEKNVEAFLSLDVEGSKVLVGDGPLLPSIRQRFPRAFYLGYRDPKSVAEICSVSDVMVFPSRTDTFGHVILEALSCGLPVAAYPVQGPLDILTDPRVGTMNMDLAIAVRHALKLDRSACAAFARRNFSWDTSVRSMLASLTPIHERMTLRVEEPAR